MAVLRREWAGLSRTSVNQIKRFYARYLPLSGELIKNLQSFGEEEMKRAPESKKDAGAVELWLRGYLILSDLALPFYLID
jgi:hypothetical protein